jgi:hypothetical protein
VTACASLGLAVLLLLPVELAGSSLRKVTFPGKPWALVLDLPGFEFSDRSARPDGKGISVFGANESTGVIVSIYLEHAAGPGGASACRDYYMSKPKLGRPDRRDVGFSERDNMAIVEYYGPRVGNAALDNQRHLNAFLSHDDIWIDLHLSKADFKPSDRARFDAILSSVRFVGGTQRETATVDSPRPGALVSETPSFAAPGGKWSLKVELQGFVQQGATPSYETQSDDGTSAYRHSGMVWHGASTEMGLAMIVAISEAKRERDANACRSSAWREFRSDLAARPKEPRLFEKQEAQRLDYLVPRMNGRQVDGKYSHAFYFRDGYCVTVTLFKTDYRPEDDASIDAVMRSIQFRDEASEGAPQIPPGTAPSGADPGER